MPKMQIANIQLSLGGDHGNTISKFGVTAAEIAVLRAIHGDESVQDVQPIGEIERPNKAERERLLAIYGGAKDGQQNPIVGTMFPGVAARVFERIDELELPEDFFRPTGRVGANDAPQAELSVEDVENSEAPTGATQNDGDDDVVGDDIDDAIGQANNEPAQTEQPGGENSKLFS